MSISLKGKKSWNEGLTASTNSILKRRSLILSEKFKGRRNPMYNRYGKLNPNWRGGVSKNGYSSRFRSISKRIRERDCFACAFCLDYGNQVHHIDFNKNNNNPLNLITLCKYCHGSANRKETKNAIQILLEHIMKKTKGKGVTWQKLY